MNNEKRLLLVPVVFGIIMIFAGIFISSTLDNQETTAPQDTDATDSVATDTDNLGDPLADTANEDPPSEPIPSETPLIDDERQEDIPRYECNDIRAEWDYPGYNGENATVEEFPWQFPITSGAPDSINSDGYPVYSPRCVLRSAPGQNPGPWVFRIYQGEPMDPDNFLTSTPTQNAYVLPEVTNPPSQGNFYTAACVEVQDIDLDPNANGLGPLPSSDFTVRQICIQARITAPEAAPPPAPIQDLPRTNLDREDVPLIIGGLLVLSGTALFIRYRML
ncbi:MAG: hypothetical protein ACOCXP_02055 [Candidatus Dojkabacteria bacterium]